MSLMVALTAAQEQRLQHAAQARHMDSNILLQQLLDTALNQLDFPVTAERVAGLHAGQIVISDDFDDPLPDEFWLGTE